MTRSYADIVELLLVLMLLGVRGKRLLHDSASAAVLLTPMLLTPRRRLAVRLLLCAAHRRAKTCSLMSFGSLLCSLCSSHVVVDTLDQFSLTQKPPECYCHNIMDFFRGSWYSNPKATSPCKLPHIPTTRKRQIQLVE